MTKLDIWNRALALLPHDRPVESEDEESTEALRCRQHWDVARKSVLTAREWGWAAQEAPACCGANATGGWFCFRPPEALLVIGLYTLDGRRVASDPVNGGLRAREPFTVVRYIQDEPDPDRWPPAFQEAVATELAARIAPVMTDNPARSAELRQAALAALEEAGHQDAQETAGDGGDPLVFVHARR